MSHASRLQTFLKQIVRSPFTRNASLLTASSALAQLVAISLSPILTRLYRPEDFGVYLVYASTVSLLSIVAAGRYELAIALPDEQKTAANICVLTLCLIFLFCVAVGVLGWGLKDVVGEYDKLSELRACFWLIPPGVLVSAFYNSMTYLSVRNGAYRMIGASNLIQGLGIAGIQVSLGGLSRSIYGLTLGDFLGRAASLFAFIPLVKREFGKNRRSLSFRLMVRCLVLYRRFPLFTGPAAFINGLSRYLPAFLIAGVFGPAPAGFFALANKVATVPMTFMGQSVAKVYFGRAVELARNDSSALMRFFLTCSATLFLLSSIPLCIVLLFGPSLFGWFFGNHWTIAGNYARGLAVMAVLKFSVNPVSQTLNILERQDLQLAWDVGRFSAVAGLFVLAGMRHWSPHAAVMGYAGLMSVGYVVLFLLTASAIRRDANRPRKSCN